MNSEHTTHTAADLPPSLSWGVHEHLSGETQQHAEKLVRSAGSVEAAKQVVEAVQQRQEPPASKDDFAKQLGFVSYLDMFEASTPVASSDGKHWAVTPTKHDKWLAWNEQDLPGHQEFSSRAEAVQYVKHRGGDASPEDAHPARDKEKPQFNQS